MELKIYSVSSLAHARSYGSAQEIYLFGECGEGAEITREGTKINTKMSYEVFTSTRLIVVCILVLFSAYELPPAASISTAENPNHRNTEQSPGACDASEYKQFDFWIGDWDTFDRGSTIPNAHVNITKILDGCVIHEEYAGADRHRGESFSVYDKSRRVWHQSWVTNRGELLMIEGTFTDGQMVLSGLDLTAGGRKRIVRGIWKAEPGGVRETAVRSIDGGKSWEPWFDLDFRPHPAKS
jgi:hypothetical protein